jgi:hypothetical protein
MPSPRTGLAILLMAICVACQQSQVGKTAPTAAASTKLAAATATSAATNASATASTSAPATTATTSPATSPAAAPTGPSAPATIVASGVLTTASYPLSNFVQVAAEFFTVTVSAGPFSVSVTADDNVFDRLRVVVDGQRLILGLVPETTLRGVTLKANVTLPDLTGLVAVSAAHMTVSGFTGSGSRSISASGASTVTATMDSGPLQVDLTGASSGQLSGRCTDMQLRASGASHLDAMALTCSSSAVGLSGASDGTITATSVQGQLSGASRLLYGPETTTVRVGTSGASSFGRR